MKSLILIALISILSLTSLYIFTSKDNIQEVNNIKGDNIKLKSVISGQYLTMSSEFNSQNPDLYYAYTLPSAQDPLQVIFRWDLTMQPSGGVYPIKLFTNIYNAETLSYTQYYVMQNTEDDSNIYFAIAGMGNSYRFEAIQQFQGDEYLIKYTPTGQYLCEGGFRTDSDYKDCYWQQEIQK